MSWNCPNLRSMVSVCADTSFIIALIGPELKAESRLSIGNRRHRGSSFSYSIALRGAQLKHVMKVRRNEDMPMADSLIAPTGALSKAVCITDSPHFKGIPEIRRKWT